MRDSCFVFVPAPGTGDIADAFDWSSLEAIVCRTMLPDEKARVLFAVMKTRCACYSKAPLSDSVVGQLRVAQAWGNPYILLLVARTSDVPLPNSHEVALAGQLTYDARHHRVFHMVGDRALVFIINRGTVGYECDAAHDSPEASPSKAMAEFVAIRDWMRVTGGVEHILRP